jgi:hypothetical protein
MNDNKVQYDFNDIDLTRVTNYERRELMGNYYLYLVDVMVDWDCPYEVTKQMILDEERGQKFEINVHLIWSYRNAGIPIPEHLKKFSPRKRIPTFIEIDEEDLK